MSVSHPQHLAVIMDGNRRWATLKHKNYTDAYYQGVESAKRLVLSCKRYLIPYVSFFVFSTENWKRPRREVDFIVSLLSGKLRKHYNFYEQHDIKVVYSGFIDALGARSVQEINKVTQSTVNNGSITVNLACNYGGRNEIVRAVHRLIENECVPSHDSNSKEDVNTHTKDSSPTHSHTSVLDTLGVQQQSELLDELPRFTTPRVPKITESLLYSYFDQPSLPNVDLVIRTGGEKRISNFCLWQIAYSELYFTDVLWPDWQESDFESALQFYQSAKRNFGS